LEYDQHVSIDLHIHSTASDGTLSPYQILKLAKKSRLGAIAIVDHDTVAGAKEARTLNKTFSLNLLPGVEISASPVSSHMLPGTFHILGYGIDLDDPALNGALEILRNARRDRNPRIIERLSRLGVNLTMADVLADNPDNDQIGRPHIARIMVKRRFVQSINEAFDLYLAVGKPAYVDKYRMACGTAIDTIRGAGGMAVLAHPFLLQLRHEATLESLVVTLKSMGLAGIEAYYPDHSPSQTAGYIELANRYGLLITGGSDYHGSLKSDTQMGTGRGNLHVPFELYERLIQRATGS